MGQDISTDETLDVLTLKGRFNNGGFEQDVVRKDKPYKIFMAGNVSRGRGSDVRNTNRVEPKLSGQTLADHATSCASINQR